jgi:hypothetical protein
MFDWNRRLTPLEERCNDQIKRVAESADAPGTFQKQAQAAARELGPTSAQTLASLCHPERDSPAELKDKFPTLGHWVLARNLAIFEILYHFREAALPALRQAAFGEADWKQSNAIEIMCRFASEGLLRNEILEELKRELPHLSRYTLDCALRPIMRQAMKSKAMQDVLNELLTIKELQDAYDEI